MDSRLYFVLGDLGGNILIGLVVGWSCAMLVAVGWPMFMTMLLTMAIGMLLGLIFWLPLAYFCWLFDRSESNGQTRASGSQSCWLRWV